MGLFSKPLLPVHYENEDVQVSAELCSNIAINVIGLARGEITILSGNDDMIHIRTSVQAKESIIKNAAALEPVQNGNTYTYTIHTPLEARLERSVTFQVFITIPRNLDSLESFSINGAHMELSIGNISHTFIKNFSVTNARGDITIESFYGEQATLKNSGIGGISGKYSVARLYANTKAGKIQSKVHLLNTDEQQPGPKVTCVTLNHPVQVSVDGTDLFGAFTVEAKTHTQPLDVKILLASTEQRLLGNFINFGAPTRIKLSGNYQGRIEARTHYGKIHIDEPEFERIEGAVLSLPSLSDRKTPPSSASPSSSSLVLQHQQQRPVSSSNSSASSSASSPSSPSPSIVSASHQSTPMSSRASSHGGTVWDKDDPRYHQTYLCHPHNGSQYSHPHPHPHHSYQNPNGNPTSHSNTHNSAPASIMAGSSGPTSRAGSMHGSFSESRSVHTTRSEKERRKKDDDKDTAVTKEVIGTIGQGTGLVMAKNSSGDITISLV
ncbi:hypothetical protein BGZ70_005903 [Mortierella alpina]|uniref:Adhesin domain-containing protein n=1 Tax=Mortierella alpina TaxID=64518 RepID=A0A9P6M495_MORAP|nr:hypothetical protein BGZ70_005903 [Mortierella alpina]